MYRGNVETRLRKLADGAVDATLLAVAGLNRLGLADRITAPIPARRHAAGGGAGRDRHRDAASTTRIRPVCSQPLNDAATSFA